MLRLVCAHIVHQVPHRAAALGHVPVRDGNIGYRKVRVGPLLEMAGLDLADDVRIGVHGLLLEVADEAVAGARRQQVGEEEAVEEDALRAQDHHLHEPPGLRQLEEGEQVHALVEGLLEERLDPATRCQPRFSVWGAGARGEGQERTIRYPASAS